MSALRCLLRLHDWNRLKWGVDAWLNLRECRRCGRFEAFGFGQWVRIDRRWRHVYADAHPVGASRP